ncbi:ribose transport system permease protein [Bosea sp. OK403]|jgi:ribose transport system permease protein|uniref:ABC transporter permease n=1 Tax=Bosea sp. OK403 TaxID=1855286 RepID=UPI0008F08850|nr:ABC transporter permease [Bosea sp. OK403]SFJ74125.1 ribose transport system permease protein [Bosea sp. OK403]
MSALAVPAHRQSEHSLVRTWFERRRGPFIAVAAFCLCLGIVKILSGGTLGYYEIGTLAAGGATLAIAATGQTIVILTGGFDLSAAAVISLVNVTLAGHMQSDPASIVLWTLAGIGIGAATGAFNGLFIAGLRLQPIVVTLATMFILQGVTLLVMDKPGGEIPPGFAQLLIGDAIPGVLPMPVLLLLALVGLWLALRNTVFGKALLAVGSDREAARASGLSVRLHEFFAYVLAGAFYGLAGVFISAQTGSGDPLVGNPMLLQMFAAVVLGGTQLGGGRGGPVGTIFGAYVLMLVVNILLVLNVPAFYSSIVEGAILILAVLGASLSSSSVLARTLRTGLRRAAARRAGTLPRQLDLPTTRLALPAPSPALDTPPFWRRNAEALRNGAPAYLCFVAVLVATQIVLGNAILSWPYYDSLIVLGCFLAILALGQGTVILTGGLDLSLPWTIGLCGILCAGLLKGSDAALIYAVPVVLGLGALVGLVNGLGIVALGLSPIVMTLAMNGILQGIALVYSGGTPNGFAAPALRWFMTGRVLGVTPIVPFLLLFVAGAVVLLGRTAFGRRVYAIGNGERPAELSGVPVKATLLRVYMLSGVCAALVGILLAGFSGQGSLGMGDDYLLPSIAVVVVGGALITGGRGSYAGMIGGVLLLTALQTLLAGTTLPYATRAILYGVVVLGAVVALREKSS